MSSAKSAERPVALIVEDRKTTLDTRRKIFAQYGFQSIGARSMSEALREFRSTPAIDILVTDINLDERNTNDRSGVDLAKTVRGRRPKMPVIAISGQFDALYPDEKATFDDSLLKGALDTAAFANRLENWHKIALNYRNSRAERARSELARMRDSAGGVQHPEVEVLRDFLPGVHLSTDDGEFDTPDDMLRREGWRLRLVEAGFQLAAIDGHGFKTAIAVPFWLRHEGDVVIAVLHGHSCIYHDAPSEQEAVNGALELMLGYAQEFANNPPTAYTGELEQLRAYLQRAFE